MFADNTFIEPENAQRLSLGIFGALAVHVLILIWLTIPISKNMVSADTYSPPTNVSIHFRMPIQEKPMPVQEVIKIEPVKPMPIIKKVVKVIPQKPIVKPVPEELNVIEPAARVIEVSVEPVHKKIIPIVSGGNIKGRRVQPQYPKRAQRLRQEGVVWIHVLISKTGERQEIKIHMSSKYELLNKAALKAVKKWTFDPHFVNGRAVQSWVEIPIEFKLQ